MNTIHFARSFMHQHALALSPRARAIKFPPAPTKSAEFRESRHGWPQKEGHGRFDPDGRRIIEHASPRGRHGSRRGKDVWNADAPAWKRMLRKGRLPVVDDYLALRLAVRAALDRQQKRIAGGRRIEGRLEVVHRRHRDAGDLFDEVEQLQFAVHRAVAVDLEHE